MLHIHLLGEFSLACDGTPVTDLITPRMQSLLAYLLLHRNMPQSRQHLAFLLWPDSTEAQARTNLRKVLYDLRQAVPAVDRCLHAEGTTLQFRADAPLILDVAEFQNAIALAAPGEPAAQAALERAVGLYHGELLPDCYDEWVTPERERLGQAYVAALDALVHWYESRRDYRPAIAHAQRLLQQDPLNETLYCTLMRLHALLGDRASVERVYQACRNTLQAELGLEPGDETRAMHARIHARLIQTGAQAQVAPTAQSPVRLVGRLNEWQQLLRTWEATALGMANCLLIEGEAGIGKTRLAEEFVAWAAHQGMATATARSYAAEGALPFAPIVAWLRSEAIQKKLDALDEGWLSEVSRLLPELLPARPGLRRPSPLTEGWQRQRLLEALARATLNAAPLLLFFDDLQWADRETLEWLHFLLRFDARARLMVIGTVRSEELNVEHPLWGFEKTLQREGHLVKIELDPLNATETGELATCIAGHTLSPDQMAHLYRETEGLPLFIVESMRVAGGEAGTMTGVAQAYLSPSVQAVIMRRLGQLSAGARDLAGLAATIGREFSLDVLARASASEWDEATFARYIDELLLHRIIRERQGGSLYDFSHDKIREAAYAGLSGVRRRMLHRHVAESLEAVYAGRLNPSIGQIAAHYEQAGLPQLAMGYYQRAAEYARRIYANADAIRCYQRAESLFDVSSGDGTPPTPGPSWPGISEALGDVLHHVAQDEDARAAYSRALARTDEADSTGRAKLHRKIGNTYRDQRQYQEALQAYRAAEETLGDSADAVPEWWWEWIQIQLETNLVFYWLRQVDASAELIKRLRPIIERHGTPSQQGDFFQSLGSWALRYNRNVATEEAVSNFKAALDAFVKAGDHARIPAATFGAGFVLLWHADPEQAEKPLLEALDMAERTGDTSLIARCVTYLAIAYRQMGQVQQAQHFVSRSFQAAEAAHMPEYTALAEANAAWVAWRVEDWSGVCAHALRAIELWGQLPRGHASAPFQWTALCPLIATAIYEDDISQAIGHAQALLDPTLQRLPDGLAGTLERAIQVWDRGQREDARDLLTQSVSLARQFRLL